MLRTTLIDVVDYLILYMLWVIHYIYMYSNIKEKLIKYKVDSKWVYTHEYFI